MWNRAAERTRAWPLYSPAALIASDLGPPGLARRRHLLHLGRVAGGVVQTCEGAAVRDCYRSALGSSAFRQIVKSTVTYLLGSAAPDVPR